MRKNVGVSHFILEYLKEVEYGLTLHDFYRHFPDTKEQTIRSALSKLKDSGNVFVESGKFLQLIVENIEVSTDHSIKIQYIQEGRKLLKEMR